MFQVADESPNAMTAWLIHDVRREENLLQAESVEFVAAGPVCARFRVRHRFRSSRIDEELVFYREVPRVDFEARIDWCETGGPEQGVPQLKVAFAADLAAVRARTEGPFVVREIPANGMERPTQKWADLAGDGAGFTLLNDSKYGVDALGGRLRLTLLRNAYGPDPETDNGVHTVRFAFEPHGGRPFRGRPGSRGHGLQPPAGGGADAAACADARAAADDRGGGQCGLHGRAAGRAFGRPAGAAVRDERDGV